MDAALTRTFSPEYAVDTLLEGGAQDESAPDPRHVLSYSHSSLDPAWSGTRLDPAVVFLVRYYPDTFTGAMKLVPGFVVSASTLFQWWAGYAQINELTALKAIGLVSAAAATSCSTFCVNHTC